MEMSNVGAIKMFFEMDGGRKITMEEMKSLSTEEREELGKLCKQFFENRIAASQ